MAGSFRSRRPVREYDLERLVHLPGSRHFLAQASEAEKAAIQQRLQLALDAGGFSVWLLWPEGQRLEWDDNTCRLNGVNPGSAPDDFSQWVKLLYILMIASGVADDGSAASGKRVYTPGISGFLARWGGALSSWLICALCATVPIAM